METKKSNGQNNSSEQTLLELIKEDRIEIREIKNRIYLSIQNFVMVALAINAFFLEKRDLKNNKILISIDLILLVISWIFFLFLKRDLRFTRKCLKGRQDLLLKLSKLNYFPDCKNVDVDIKDNNLYIAILLLTVIYIVLIIITIFLYDMIK